MKLPGLHQPKPHSNSMDSTRHLAGEARGGKNRDKKIASGLSAGPQAWRHHGVAQLGDLTRLPAAHLPTAAELPRPQHVPLVPTPRHKPNATIRQAHLEVAEVLSHPKTKLEKTISQLWFAPDNPAYSPPALRNYMEQKYNGFNFSAIMEAQLDRKVPVAQLVDAIDGYHDLLDRDAIEAMLTIRGAPPPAQWLQSIENSSVVHTRLKLHEQGFAHLDGRGIEIWVVETDKQAHNDFVAAVINDQKYGLAPGATVKIKHIPQITSTSPVLVEAQHRLDSKFGAMVERLTKQLDNPAIDSATLTEQLKSEFRPLVAEYLDPLHHDLTEQIKAFTASDAQILNLSISRDVRFLLSRIVQLAHRMGQSSPDLVRAIVEKPHLLNGGMLLGQEITPFLLDAAYPVLSSPKHAPGLQAYVDATGAAAEKGKIITVASANANEVLRAYAVKEGISLPDSLALNPYAMSPHVVAVGASQVNGTPLNFSDDTMAPFSSFGGPDHPITVATQGVSAAVPYRVFIALRGNNHGSSASAPTAAGMAALFKQAIPNAGIEEFKNFLAARSIKIDAPDEAQGAGVLDLLDAGLSLGEKLGKHNDD